MSTVRKQPRVKIHQCPMRAGVRLTFHVDHGESAPGGQWQGVGHLHLPDRLAAMFLLALRLGATAAQVELVVTGVGR